MNLKKTFGYKLARYFLNNPRYAIERFSIMVGQIFRGIDTYKNEELTALNIPSNTDAYMYESSGNSYLVNMLKNFNITHNDVIVDFGSGKGGALMYMSRFPFKKIIGVEYSQFLFELAQKNIAKLQLKNIELVQGDAAAYTNLDKVNYVYMFNPFGLATMEPVLQNIQNSYTKNPRKITLIYKNAVHHDAILKNNFFKKVNQYKGENADFFIYQSPTP